MNITPIESPITSVEPLKRVCNLTRLRFFKGMWADLWFRLQLIINEDTKGINNLNLGKSVFLWCTVIGFRFALFLIAVAMIHPGVRFFCFGISFALTIACLPLLMTMPIEEFSSYNLRNQYRKPTYRECCGELGEWVWQGWKIRYTYIHNPKSTVPLLLVHGFGGSIGHWRQNISELAKHHSVYAIDLLGFGASSKPVTPYNIHLWVKQIHEFWQTFMQVPAVLVGNSIGSVTCLAAAATHPEMVRGVAMISLPDLVGHSQTIPIKLRPLVDRIQATLTSPFVLEPLFYLLRQPWVVKRWAGFAYTCKEAVTEELLEILTTPAREQGAARAFCAILQAMSTQDFSPCIRSILTNLKSPSLLLWGQQDRMIPPSSARNFLKLNSRMRLVELENAGHCAHDECPERVNYELINWIQTQVLPKQLSMAMGENC